MKRVGNLWEQVMDRANLLSAFHRAARGKRWKGVSACVRGKFGREPRSHEKGMHGPKFFNGNFSRISSL